MMRRISMVFTALCLLLCMCAAVGEGGLDNAIDIEWNGRAIRLSFDTSGSYSAVVDGSVQACFYAYDTVDAGVMYELYLVFPESVKPGDVITPDYARQYAPECSVMFVVSTQQSEVYYFAAQVENGHFPEGSDYAIRIAEVTKVDGGVRYAGRLSATLTGIDTGSNGSYQASVKLTDAPFSFTMPEANRRTIGDTPTPAPTPDLFDAAPTPAPFDEPIPAAPSVTPAQTWRI